jgi:hypothetical protein
VSSNMQTFVTSAIIASLTLNLFLTMFLQQLWGLINTLQFVIHVPLLAVNVPPNV